MKTLLDVCRAVQDGSLTLDEAAERFGISTKSMQARITKWGPRLTLLAKTLDAIRDDKITRSEAAERLGTGVRNVNALMDRWRVERPVSDRVVQRTFTEVKWEIRKKAALDYIRGTANLEAAAAEADVSDRQIRRWVSELLQKHFEMTWGELQHLAMNRRFRLAQEIEKAEGLELATKKVVEAITSGDKSIIEEVEERVAARAYRKFPQT